MTFKFQLKDKVQIIDNHTEKGIVVSRSDYINNENCYRLRYIGEDGVTKLDWFDESELEKQAEA